MRSEIQEFYKNQTIFITGGTGLIGKLIVEKLLRACFDLTRIYLLVRPKKGKSPEERFDDIFKYPCFDILKEQQPTFRSKIRLIIGDCSQPNLGISATDWELLTNEVTCVFHVAANVRFDEPIRSATKSNVLSTQEMLKLAENIASLKIFVHVSTAYSHCPRPYIEENFYKPPILPKTLLALVDQLDDVVLEKITPVLIGDWPNTYSYTKAVSEEVVRQASQRLPIVVVRPSIVTSTFSEPIPGWIEQFYGVSGIAAGIFLGAVKSTIMSFTANSHLVPCDYVANATITAAWDYFQQSNDESNKTKIYNFVASDDHYLSWGECGKTTEKLLWEYSLLQTITYPNYETTSNRTYHRIRRFFWHTCVAYFADIILRILQREPIAVKNYKRLDKMLDLTDYFTTRNWIFDRRNVINMWKRLNEFDKKLFPFDMDNIDLEKYIHIGLTGGRKYLLNEGPETIEPAKRRLYKLMIIHYCFIGFLLLITYFVVNFAIQYCI